MFKYLNNVFVMNVSTNPLLDQYTLTNTRKFRDLINIQNKNNLDQLNWQNLLSTTNILDPNSAYNTINQLQNNNIADNNWVNQTLDANQNVDLQNNSDDKFDWNKVFNKNIIGDASQMLLAAGSIYNNTKNLAKGATNNTMLTNQANNVANQNSLASDVNTLQYDFNNLQQMNGQTYKSIGGVSNSQIAKGTLTNTLAGGLAGSKFGPIGTLVGAGVGLTSGIVGGIFGRNKAKNQLNALNNRINNANQNAVNNLNARADEIDNKNAYNATINFGFGGNMYNNGGSLFNNDLIFDNGITYINEGGTHEENANQGVPVSYDQQGIPNLVEEGETIVGDYVYSNRLNVPDDVKELLGLGKKDITYAEATKKLAKESEEQPYDDIIKRALNKNLETLKQSQEQVKQEQEQLENELSQYQQQPNSLEEEISQYQNDQNALDSELAQYQQQGEIPNQEELVPQEEMMQQMLPQTSYAFGGNMFAKGGSTKHSYKGYSDAQVQKWYKQGLAKHVAKRTSQGVSREDAIKEFDKTHPGYGSFRTYYKQGGSDYKPDTNLVMSLIPFGDRIKSVYDYATGKIDSKTLGDYNKQLRWDDAISVASLLPGVGFVGGKVAGAAVKGGSKLLKGVKNAKSANKIIRRADKLTNTTTPTLENVANVGENVTHNYRHFNAAKNTYTRAANIFRKAENKKPINKITVSGLRKNNEKLAQGDLGKKYKEASANLKKLKEDKSTPVDVLQKAEKEVFDAAEKLSDAQKWSGRHPYAASFWAKQVEGGGMFGNKFFYNSIDSPFTNNDELEEELMKYNTNNKTVATDEEMLKYLEPTDELQQQVPQQIQQPTRSQQQRPQQQRPKQTYYNNVPQDMVPEPQDYESVNPEWFAFGGNMFDNGGEQYNGITYKGYAMDGTNVPNLVNENGRISPTMIESLDKNPVYYDYTIDWDTFNPIVSEVAADRKNKHGNVGAFVNENDNPLYQKANKYYFDQNSDIHSNFTKQIQAELNKAITDANYKMNPAVLKYLTTLNPLYSIDGKGELFNRNVLNDLKNHGYNIGNAKNIMDFYGDMRLGNRGPYNLTPMVKATQQKALVPEDPITALVNKPAGKANLSSYTHSGITPTDIIEDLEKKDELAKFRNLSRLRYAPVVGSAGNLIYNLNKGPEYDFADNADSLAQQINTPATIPVDVIGNYRKTNPFDERYLVNLNNQNANAYARTGINTSGGNRAAAMGYARAGNFAQQLNNAEIMRNAYTANRADDSDVATFNRATDQYNSGVINNRNNAVAEINNNRYLTSMQGRLNANTMRQQIKDEYDKAINNDIANITQTLGSIGDEANNTLLLDWYYRNGIYNKGSYDPTMQTLYGSGSTTKNQNKYGGKIKRWRY